LYLHIPGAKCVFLSDSVIITGQFPFDYRNNKAYLGLMGSHKSAKS